MTTGQKWIVIVGLVAMALVTLVPPFRYVGSSMEVEAGRPRFVPVTGTLHRAAWTPRPKSLTVPADTGRGIDFIMIESIGLDDGRLGLWWAGIALVTLAAVALAAPRRDR